MMLSVKQFMLPFKRQLLLLQLPGNLFEAAFGLIKGPHDNLSI